MQATAPTSRQTLASTSYDPKAARALILQGRAPAGMRVTGTLKLNDCHTLTELPAGLSARKIDLRGCTALQRLPAGLSARHVIATGCSALRELPAGLRCYELDLSHSAIQTLPDDLQVEYRLDLEGCSALRELPAGLQVGSLILRDCTALEQLPEGLAVYFLDIAGCTALTSWPQQGAIQIGRLNARGCSRLRGLPDWLHELSQLDLAGCTGISDLPATLRVSSWIDIAHTAISWLPVGVRGARLRWRGVPIDERIAFHPDTITIEEILSQENVELRRVLLERMGYEAFLASAHATVVDRDRDVGGERRLLRVSLAGDEPLVCVAVRCPSTGRQYLIRVPPNIRTYRHAVAWIAGFDNPNDYRPLVET